MTQWTWTMSACKGLWGIENEYIFHAGTNLNKGQYYSSGGRVLNFVSSSENLIEARRKSLSNINKINWLDGFCRKDIGWKTIGKK